jgi:hypothetical protein
MVALPLGLPLAVHWGRQNEQVIGQAGALKARLPVPQSACKTPFGWRQIGWGRRVKAASA